jgi:hypothetical protein
MLTGITLENFKAFKEPQFIPIKPITLVFGPNSAGKSSIIQALAFLKYVHYSHGHCDPETVEYGWDKIHLGPWHNLVHGHDATTTMRITLHFESCAIMWAFKKCKYGPRVDSFVFLDNDQPIARGQNADKDQKIPSIQWSVELHARHPFWKDFQKELWDLASGERQAYTSALETADEVGSEPDEELLEICRDPGRGNFRLNFKSIFSAYFENWVGDSWKELPFRPNQNRMTSLFPGLEEYFGEAKSEVFWPLRAGSDGSESVMQDTDFIF